MSRTLSASTLMSPMTDPRKRYNEHGLTEREENALSYLAFGLVCLAVVLTFGIIFDTIYKVMT